jgi:CRISPR-associated protein Cst1
MGFADFMFLVPLDNRPRLRLLRDYLLAFLFERAREMLPEDETAVDTALIETI